MNMKDHFPLCSLPATSSASAKYIGPVFLNVGFIIAQDFCGGKINSDDEEKQVSIGNHS
jgi:hypothetical protein